MELILGCFNNDRNKSINQRHIHKVLKKFVIELEHSVMLMQSGIDQINIGGNINMTLNLHCHQLQNITNSRIWEDVIMARVSYGILSNMPITICLSNQCIQQRKRRKETLILC